MYLSEIFDQLAFGELSQANLKNTNTGVQTSDYEKLTHFTNTALTALHTRFNIKQKILYVTQIEGIEEYKLIPENAATSDSDAAFKFIADSPQDPFLGGLIKITEVHDEEDEPVGINDNNDPLSVYTPQLNVLQIPYAKNGNTTTVFYRADHRKLNPSTVVPTNEPIELPPAYLKALKYHIAANFFSGKSRAEDSALHQKFEMLYESECARIESNDMNISNNLTSTILESNGWV